MRALSYSSKTDQPDFIEWMSSFQVTKAFYQRGNAEMTMIQLYIV